MLLSRQIVRCAVSVLALLAAAPAAHAQKGEFMGGAKTPAQMCIFMADMPKPDGEWDLKGNPKLAQYCGCYDKLFTARALKAAGEDFTKAPPLAQQVKEETAMRSTCRKQFSLPPVPPAP